MQQTKHRLTQGFLLPQVVIEVWGKELSFSRRVEPDHKANSRGYFCAQGVLRQLTDRLYTHSNCYVAASIFVELQGKGMHFLKLQCVGKPRRG